MALQNRMRMRVKHGGTARSRTPSPMYLELQPEGRGQNINSMTKGFMHPDEDGLPLAESGGSGGHTPRANAFGLQWSTPSGDNIAAKNEKPLHMPDEVKRRGSPKNIGLPSQDEVGSTNPGMAAFPGYGRKFKDMSPSTDALAAQAVACNAFFRGVPGIDLGDGLPNYSAGNSCNYSGQSSFNVEVPMPTAFGYPVFQLHGHEQPNLGQGHPDLNVANGFIPPPPAPPGFDTVEPSMGSHGHPHSCEKGCKYVRKKRGCRDGANCLRCHFCPANKPQNPNPQHQVAAAPTNVPARTKSAASVGSLGHPYSCAAACKYNGKKSGCKDGQLCIRCHLCRWTRCMDRGKCVEVEAEAKAKAPTTKHTCEMSTQTTVDQSTQCDMSDDTEEDKHEPALYPFGEVITCFSV